MNNVLSLVRSARRLSEPGAILYSDHMLAELVALHDDMIAQLRLECLRAVGSTNFLTGMIAEHEQRADELRAHVHVAGTVAAMPGASTTPAPKRRGRWLRRSPGILKRQLTAAL